MLMTCGGSEMNEIVENAALCMCNMHILRSDSDYVKIEIHELY